MRFFGSFGVTWAAKGEKGGFQKFPKNGKSGVAHPFGENGKSLFSLSKSIENASGGSPGTAQRAKKRVFRKTRFFRPSQEKHFFHVFSVMCFLRRKRGKKKRSEINKKVGKRGKMVPLRILCFI